MMNNKYKEIVDIILNETFFITKKCNDYIHIENIDDKELTLLDEKISLIFIALLLNYFDENELIQLKQEVINGFKNFAKPFVFSDNEGSQKEKLELIDEKLYDIQKFLKPCDDEDSLKTRIRALVDGNKIKNFFIDIYDKQLISEIINHFQLSKKLFEEIKK